MSVSDGREEARDSVQSLSSPTRSARGDEPPDVGEATRSWSPHRENGMQHHLGGIEIVCVEGGERPPDGFSKRTTDTPVEALQQPRCVEVLGEPSAYF